MSPLKDLQPGERGLLIGLPYRVGVWMSHSDDESGEGDDEKEMAALKKIIASIAKTHEESVFVQDVARHTLNREEKWEKWAEHSFDILADCEKAVEVLKRNVNDNDRKDYCRTLINIAETVAAAYGEFGMGADEDEGVFGGFLDKMVTKLKGEGDEIDFTNISPAESEALDRLKAVLSDKDED